MYFGFGENPTELYQRGANTTQLKLPNNIIFAVHFFLVLKEGLITSMVEVLSSVYLCYVTGGSTELHF